MSGRDLRHAIRAGRQLVATHCRSAAWFLLHVAARGLMILLTSSLLIVMSGQGRAGEPPAPAETDGPPQYRRILVQEEQLPELARGYLPIKRDEFSLLLSAWRDAGTQGPAARVVQADMWGRWDSRQMIAGRLRWRVAQPHEVPTWLSLEPYDLPLSDPVWQRAELPPQPARVGFSVHGVGVLTIGTADLSGTWSLPGRREPGDETRFAMRWPRSSIRRLWLDLPRELEVTATAGLAISEEEALVGDGALAAPSDLPPIPDGNWRRWLLLPTGEDLQWTVHRRQRAAWQEPNVIWRDDATYEVTPQGIEVRCNLRLDIAGEPLRQLHLEAPVDLRIGAVRIGDSTLRWTDRLNPASALRDIELELPDLRGTDRVVQVTGLMALPAALPWTLPTIRCRGLFWQEGKAQVTVYEPLEAGRLRVRGGRQTRVGTLAAPQPATTFQVQLHAPDASLQLWASEPKDLWHATVGTTIDIDEATITANSVAACTVRAGRPAHWDAIVPSAWVIDGVESSADTRLEDFDLVPTADGNYQHLFVRLHNPLPRDRTLQLTVRAHRARPVEGARLSCDQLRVLQLRDDAETRYDARYMVAVNADSESRVRWVRDRRVNWLRADQLRTTEAALLEPRPGAALFMDDEAARELEMEFASVPPAYQSQLEVTARLGPGSLVESYRLVCEPRVAGVSRLLVLFSQARPELLNWSLEEDTEEVVTARRLPIEELQAVTRAAGEGWEIQLRTPRNDRFVLRAERTTPWVQRLPLALATMPEADTQSGIVRIEARGVPVDVDAAGAESIPLGAANPQLGTSAIAAFRFDPADARDIVVEPRSAASPMASAWAWTCRLVTQHARSGETLHEVSYWIENRGLDRIQLRLPASAAGVQWKTDEQPTWRTVEETDSKGWLSVPLSVTTRYATVSLRFAVHRRPWMILDEVQPLVPELSIPVLSGSWRCWMPAAYEPWQATRAGPGMASNHTEGWSRLLALVRPQRWSAAKRTNWLRGLDAPGGSMARFPVRPSDLLDAREATDDEPLAREVLLALGLVIGRVSEQSPTPTWRQVWSEFEQVAARMSRSQSVLLDDIRLARSGIVPSAVLPVDIVPFTASRAMDETEQEQVIAWTDEFLASQHLRIWCGADAIAVGIADAEESDAWSDSPWKSLRVGGDSPWLENASSSGGRDVEPHDWSPVSRWLAVPPAPESPWNEARPVPPLPEIATTAWEWSLALPAPESIRVVDRRAVSAIGWLLVLASAGLLATLATRFPALVLAAPFGAAAIALLVPDSLVPPASGLFLGSVLAVLMHAARNTRPVRLRSTPAVSDDMRKVSLLTLALFATYAVSTATRSAHADEEPPVDSRPVHRVLFPIDAEGRPSGDYVHLPRDFYHQLRQRSTGRGAGSVGWIWRTARYSLELEATRGESAWSIPLINLHWELEALSAGQRVVLPLQREEATLLGQQWTRDGQPTNVVAVATEEGWQCTLEEPGVYAVDFKVRPVIARRSPVSGTLLSPSAPTKATSLLRGERWGCNLSVPRVLGATLAIQAPRTAPDLQFPTARGALVRSEAGTGWQVELGATPQLVIEWERAPEASNASVDQLTWLQIRPGAVSIETRVTYRALAGTLPRKARLAVDPRLRLLPAAVDQPTTRWIATDPDQPWVEWEWESDDTESGTIMLSFLWSGASGLGQLRVPRLEPIGVRLERNWLAVSTSPNLETTGVTGPTLVPLDWPAFAEAWGATETTATSVYRLPTTPISWHLVTRPRDARADGTQELDIVVGAERIALTLQADLHLADGQLLEYQLTTPEGAEVDEVQVLENDSNVVDTWSLIDGRLYVRFARPIAAPHQLLVRAHVDLRAGVSTPMPDLRLTGLASATRHLRILRETNALVELDGVPDTVEPATGPPRTGTAPRRLAQWTERLANDSPMRSLRVTTRPNPLRCRARTVTVLRRNREGYQPLVFGVIVVESGRLDFVRWEIPADWPLPTAVLPNGVWSRQPLPGNERQLLRLETDLGEGATLAFAFAGPSIALGEERDSVADVRTLDIDVGERYLWLPTGGAEGRLDWETSGLQATNVFQVPTFVEQDVQALDWLRAFGTSVEQLSANQMITYRVIGAKFRATLRAVEASLGQPRVVLADHYLSVDPRGRIWGLSLLDLDTAKSPDGFVTLPTDYELVHITVDGVVARVSPEGTGRWRVAWGTGEWPQRLEVLFRRSEAARGEAAQPLPTDPPAAFVEGLPIGRTLWTIATDGSGPVRPSSPRSADLESWRASLARLNGRTEIIETGAERLFHHAPREVDGWLLPWGRRWHASATDLEQPVERAAAAPLRSELEELASLTTRQADATRRLGAAESWERARQQARVATEPDQIWRLVRGPQSRVTHLEFVGGKTGAEPFRFVAQEPVEPPRSRYGLALGLVVLALGATQLVRWRLLSEWFVRSPHASGVVIGLAWWLWMPWSVVGLVIVMLVLVDAIRSPWRLFRL